MRRFQILTVAAVVVIAGIFVATAAALNIKDTPPPPGQVGVPYSFQFDMEEGSGSPGMTWRISSGSLPPGLSLSFEGERWTRVVGTPTTPGVFKFYLQAVDVPGPYVCCTEEEYEIHISSKLTISTNSLPEAAIGQAYTAPPLSAGGGTVNSWSMASGALPTGVTLSASGVISGTPTQSGNFTFTVQANGTPNNDTRQLSLFVLAPLDLGTAPTGAPVARQPVAVNMKLATPVTWGVKATGGREPYAYTANTLPAGVVLNPDGTVTGTPTQAGQTKSTITVKDARGTTDTLQVTFTTQALLAFHKTKQAKVGTVGRTYSWRLPVGGASETRIFLASGSIPPGLSLNEETGFLSGKPLAAGSFKAKFWVLGDSGTQISKTYRIKIQAAKRTTTAST